ncbi:hypothetical protein ASD99_06255 [Mesorhizobium sp. Root695]|uniref:hypothetical protein n=1 Tax=Mesorhizobium sp. Root695 TaxID=1736589 RepID=UPI00070AF99F|nr:hypothetical protein [Mesorhizobium sp. Root695]KRB21838.1 hypothetical protein ASD99_06255 [Mesorhizobium sp. Root695]
MRAIALADMECIDFRIDRQLGAAARFDVVQRSDGDLRQMGRTDAAKDVVDHQAETGMRVPVRQSLGDRSGLAVDLDIEHVRFQQCHDMHWALLTARGFVKASSDQP